MKKRFTQAHPQDFRDNVAKLSESSKDSIRNKIDEHSDITELLLLWIYYFVVGYPDLSEKIGKILKGERKQAGFKVPPEEKHEQMYKAVVDFVHELRAEEQSEG